MLTTILSITLATIIGMIALFHFYWGLGGNWPGHDAESCGRRVVGYPYKPHAAIVAVGIGLVGAALTPLGYAGIIPAPFEIPIWLPETVLWFFGAVFVVRGALGFLQQELVPAAAADQIYIRYNKFFYSPLALVLGLLCIALLYAAGSQH